VLNDYDDDGDRMVMIILMVGTMYETLLGANHLFLQQIIDIFHFVPDINLCAGRKNSSSCGREALNKTKKPRHKVQ
jgi:hypothetical protein